MKKLSIDKIYTELASKHPYTINQISVLCYAVRSHEKISEEKLRDRVEEIISKATKNQISPIDQFYTHE